VLWNIYAHELDIFINNYCKRAVTTARKHIINKDYSNTEYKRIEYELTKIKAAKDEASSNMCTLQRGAGTQTQRSIFKDTKKRYKLKQKELRKFLSTRTDPLDKGKLTYIRFADDWVILITGRKYLAEYLKRKVKSFLSTYLKLKLSPEKTHITDPQEKPVLFLGHNIAQIKSRKVKKVKGKYPRTSRVTYRDFTCRIPWEEKVLPKLHANHYCTPSGYPRELPHLTPLDQANILRHFESVMIGLANFYSAHTPKSDTQRLFYIMTYSCYKTLAHKNRSKMTSTIKQYRSDDYAASVTFKFGNETYSHTLTHYMHYKQPTEWFGIPKLEPILVNNRTKYHLDLPCEL